MSLEQRTEERTDADFSALDQALADMAEETPELPEDFHARWVQAVRREADAGRTPEAAGAEPKPEPGTGPRPAAGAWAVPETMLRAVDRRRTERRRQWRYLAGIAAVFVFLIGGTMLTRAQRTALRPAAGARRAETAAREETPAMEYGAPAEEAPAEMEETAVNTADRAAGDAEAALEETADMAFSAEPAMYAAGTLSDGGAPVAGTASVAADAEEAAEPDAEAAAEPKTEKAAAIAEAKAAETGTAGEIPETEEAADIAESPSFWEDLGRFTLSTLPWMAGVAALLAAARWTKGRKNRA